MNEWVWIQPSPIHGSGLFARTDLGKDARVIECYDLEDYRDYPCHCGAPDCVGYIIAAEFFDHLRARRARDSASTPPE